MRKASAVAVTLVTLTALSCAHDAERALLDRFFAASRLRDLTALRKIATVVFEPATDGIITSFDILQITAEQSPDGISRSKKVLISAPVRLPDGGTVTKTIVVTMGQRSAGGDQNPSRGWMITGVTAGLP